ncbi:hypothetical protein ENSA5_58640 [Enhygromyxa salina]|uniref:Uncharacterized protein n=1 Tax=Enhygromyxa salina TaxID=215803 RepID=A0A2S9XE48_9BACT|nr:hypothetical protein [Enhygromyxa salina]PRP91127.1 hypothetical protein ENSA5_58640 [Enhygromyxa salina]
MARDFSRTRQDGQPSETRDAKYVNDRRLPDDAAYAHATVAGLLQDDVLLELVTDADAAAALDDWCIVEYEADPQSVIIPNRDEVLEGVFAVPLAEIRRWRVRER